MSTSVPSQYQSYVTNAAKALGIPAAVVAAQISDESGFNPNVTSPTGAQGIAQFEPGTWASYGTGSPFNVADAFAAYTKYMGALLKQFKGNVQDALAAYNAGPGNLPAGMGYAHTILSNAGQGYSITAGPGAADATLASSNPISAIYGQGKGVVSSAGTLLHDAATALNWFFEFFHPGQGWRLVFGAGAAVAGTGAVRQWKAAGSAGEAGGALPMAIGLAGVTAITAFMALRPWPVSNAKAVRPGAYAQSILEGRPFAQGPEPAADTSDIETGLAALLGIWVVSKLASMFSGFGGLLPGGGPESTPPPGEAPPPVEAPPPPPIEPLPFFEAV